jgi:hypothetical protein
MAILKEYRCKAHGAFEAMVNQGETPDCPRGCSARFVYREIRSAPAARTVISGTLDRLQREIAHDFGLSDIKAGRDDGKSVMDNIKRGAQQAPAWLELPGHLRPGWSGRKEAPEPVTVTGFNADNSIKRTQPPKNLPTNVVGRVAQSELAKVLG